MKNKNKKYLYKMNKELFKVSAENIYMNLFETEKCREN